MGRHKASKKAFIVKMKQDKQQILEERVISLGYYYDRDGVRLPSIGRFLEVLVSCNNEYLENIFKLSIDKSK